MTVTFPSAFVGFNMSNPQVVKSDGSILWPSYVTTFNSNYSLISPELKNDLMFLSTCGVKIVRIWPGLATFYMSGGVWQSTPNANIANLDDFLTTLASLGMQALLVLIDTPESSGELTTNNLTPSMLSNSTVQNQWIAAVSNFVTRYKNNTAVWGYDLNNELGRVISNNGVLFGTTFDSSPWTALSAYCANVYSAVKAIDSTHSFTFSFGDGDKSPGSDQQTVIGPSVDFYDVHQYVGQFEDPSILWQGFQAYDKPAICGEIGTPSLPNDQSVTPHIPCETDSFNVAPALSTWCQNYLYRLCQQHLTYAKANNIGFVCFHSWPSFRWFGIRTDDGSNQWLGHQLTQAGQLVLLYNHHQIASWV